MKIKSVSILLFAIVLPLLGVIVLAVTGVTFNTWVYVVLFIICPVIAVVIWFIYKDMERKVSKKV